MTRWLRSQGITAVAYSGDSDDEHRLSVERALLGNTVKVVAATSARVSHKVSMSIQQEPCREVVPITQSAIDRSGSIVKC